MMAQLLIHVYLENSAASSGEKIYAKLEYSEETVVGVSLTFNEGIWALRKKEISSKMARNVT